MRRANDTNLPTLEQLEDRLALSHGIGGTIMPKWHAEPGLHPIHSTRNMGGGGGGGMGPCGVQVRLEGANLIIKGTKLFDNVTVRSSPDTGSFVVTRFPICANDVPEFYFVFAEVIYFDGGAGADTFTNSTDIPCIIHGGPDNDTLTTGDGIDFVLGGGGNDAISTCGGDDSVIGGGGDDVILGGGGLDSLYGNAGNDEIYGCNTLGFGQTEADSNYLNGGSGHDTLHGDYGNDTLKGGSGIDALHGYMGDNDLDGGDGSDLIYSIGTLDEIKPDPKDRILTIA